MRGSADRLIECATGPTIIDDIGPAVYLCNGLRVSSPVPLAGRRIDGPADLTLSEGPPGAVLPLRPSPDVVAEHVSAGVRWYTFATVGGSTVGRFYGTVDFELDTDLRTAVYRADPRADPGMVAILAGGALSAFVLAHRFDLVLHASAVEVGSGVLAFVGPSGQGKSTVAASMCAAGYRLVADDVLAVEVSSTEVSCVGTSTELRLRDDVRQLTARFPERRRSVDGRWLVNPEPSLRRNHALTGIVVPAPDRECRAVTVRRLSAADAIMTLTRGQRIDAWRHPETRRRQFQAAARIASTVPVVRVSLPWRSWSEDVVQSVADLSEEVGAL